MARSGLPWPYVAKNINRVGEGVRASRDREYSEAIRLPQPGWPLAHLPPGIAVARHGGQSMSDGPIRLLLVDPLLSFRSAIAFMLDREADLEVAAHCGSVAEVRQTLGTIETSIDVALVTLNLPDGAGADVLAELRVRHPACQVVALTRIQDRREHAQAIAAGLAGTIQKSCSIEEIAIAIRRVARDGTLHPPDEMISLLRLATRQQTTNLAAKAALHRLTAREREVLQALAHGLSDKEIASRLQVSANTVAAHMVNLLGKLGVDSRLQAVLLALKHGAVTLE